MTCRVALRHGSSLALAATFMAVAARAVAAAPDSPNPVSAHADPAKTGARGLVHTDTWQSRPVPPLGVIIDPVRMHRAADGTLIVTDRELHRVQRYRTDGEPVADYGREGDGDGELYGPLGAAADVERDRMYVADTENDRVAVFRLDGEFVANWTGVPHPLNVEVMPDGRVAVLLQDALWKYGPDGERIDTFPVIRLPLPQDLPTGGMAYYKGLIYIASRDGFTRMRPDGTDLGLHPKFRGANIEGRDIAVDELGDPYVLDKTSRIHRFLGGSAFVAPPLGGIVNAIVGAERRTLYAAKAPTQDQRGAIVKVTYQGTAQEQDRWGDPLTILGWLYHPLRVDAGLDGDVYVSGELYRVQRFTPDGTAKGQLSRPGLREAVALPGGDLILLRERFGLTGAQDDDPEVPASGFRRFIVERVTFDGEFVSEPKRPAEGRSVWRDTWVEPFDAADGSRFAGIAVDPRGKIYALDAGTQRILRYDFDGARQPDVPLPRLEAGLPGYADLAIDAEGRLLVLHIAARRILVFGPEGDAPEGVWPAPRWSSRLAGLPDGRIALVTGKRELWTLGRDGAVDGVWPLPRSAYDTGEPPSDLAADGEGRVYVSDRSGAAVFVLSPGEATPGAVPEGDLGCRLELASAFAAERVTVGDLFTGTLAISGTCDPHPRLKTPPPVLAKTVDVSITLPAGLVPAAEQGEAAVTDGRGIAWRLVDVPAAGRTVTFTLEAAAVGRFPMFDAIAGTYVDGWLSPGSLDAMPDHVSVYPVATPAHRQGPLYLPAVSTCRPCGSIADFRESD